MRRRWALFATYLVGVALLAVWVISRASEPNDVVDAYDTAVEARVHTADPSSEGRAVGVHADLLQQAGLYDAHAAVVLTTSAGVTVTPVPVPERDWVVHPVLIDQPDLQAPDPVDVPVGSTLVALWVAEPSPAQSSTTLVHPLDRVIEVDLPVLSGGTQVATVTVHLTPVPITGEDLDIPGSADIPDQQLPRPDVGEAIPAVLQPDRQPVWVVGLADDVAVRDARSPHLFSGLVGWCGQMPGFIDSIGGDLFTATGQYAFGPAPHGMVPYEVQVADAHVTVTRRLAPPSRFDGVNPIGPMPPIQGSPVEQSGYCDIDEDVAMRANEGGYFLEDFRDSPTWVQHDLSAWPELVDDARDGWWRTDAVDVEGLPRLTGDLLVRLERGRIIDAAAPPGVARHMVYDTDLPAETRTMEVVGFGSDPEGPRVQVRDAIWITRDGAFPADTDPDGPRTLVSAMPPTSYQLPPDAPPDLEVGDLVEVTIDDGQVTTITER